MNQNDVLDRILCRSVKKIDPSESWRFWVMILYLYQKDRDTPPGDPFWIVIHRIKYININRIHY